MTLPNYQTVRDYRFCCDCTNPCLKGRPGALTIAPMQIAKWCGILLIAGICGCGRTEWNWDWAWWQSPRRIVPPSKTDATPPTETVASRASDDREDQTATDEGHRSRNPDTPRRQVRSYYQLYLISPGADPEEHADQALHLRSAKARPCAVLLEMLCVPLGRSGNPAKCYLLYEEQTELDDALHLGPLLDVAPATAPRSTSGPGDSFELGVALMLAIVEQAAVVDSALVNAAAKSLTQALQAETLDAERRWVAGVLASRLMSEYKYDQGSARLLAQEAEAVASPGSREQFTAMYWRADALNQAGKSAEATVLYQEIAKQYGSKVTRSQLIKQPKSTNRSRKKQ